MTATERPLRFGINLVAATGRRAWAEKCRKAESLGYDVILVSDHIRLPSSPPQATTIAPLPMLMSAAEATERPRVGTFVLNTGLYNPLLLARDVAAVDQLTEGRLELGVGTGYVRGEFEAAGLEWLDARRRVDRFEELLDALARIFDEPGYGLYAAGTPRPPFLIGGNGDRLLTIAATRADIVGFSGLRQDPERLPGELTLVRAKVIEQRVAFVRQRASECGREPELNILVHTVADTADPAAATRGIRGRDAGMSDEEALELPGLLAGSPREMADQIRARRERFGFSYFTVLEPFMESFGEVIAQLR